MVGVGGTNNVREHVDFFSIFFLLISGWKYTQSISISVIKWLLSFLQTHPCGVALFWFYPLILVLPLYRRATTCCIFVYLFKKYVTWLCSPLVTRKATRVATAAVTRTTTAPILMMIMFFCSRDFRAAIRAGGSELGSGSKSPLPLPERNVSNQYVRNFQFALQTLQKNKSGLCVSSSSGRASACMMQNPTQCIGMHSWKLLATRFIF